ncbi:hypothetical protein GH975_07375 [Litorivicinus lipolyticus]|uniref:GP-PDE domain-containing protein n=1 Tax=Litorivicinus lipolyticus TaxID=418701 RepID=A0A5Q2QEX5_9GAMM|nr:glycerophosphodiester phosphodiesterase [Litorivicinus lipolyticus]QGG80400.1 hypothetical protein GH975_07375 [Litorivicinus lipolyticus]
MTGVLIGGHRGCGRTDARGGRQRVPQENSHAAIALAFSAGADFVEVDLCLDADGRGWLIHSSALHEHIHQPPALYLDQLPSHRVAQLVGLGGQPLMSLNQLIQHFGDSRVNVELKLRQGTGRASDGELSRLGLPNWPASWWLSSFDGALLEQADTRWPEPRKGLLFDDDIPAALKFWRAHRHFWLHPERQLLANMQPWPATPVVAWSLALDAGVVDTRCHAWITDQIDVGVGPLTR